MDWIYYFQKALSTQPRNLDLYYGIPVKDAEATAVHASER